MSSRAPCDHQLPSHSPIVSKVHDIISQAWGFPHVIRYNPSPNPVSLEKKTLPLVESNLTDYVIAEKSDGVRYLLVLGAYEGRGFSIMVNRKMQMFEVPVQANSEYFKGSVFDGELVIESINATQERQKFLIFDLISVKAESRCNSTFMERYNEYFGIFDLEGKDILGYDANQWDTIAFELADTKNKIVCMGNKMALQFCPKQFVHAVNLGSMWRSMNKLKHKSDGLVFVRTPAPIGTGTDPNLLKWKELHTIDLLVEGSYVKGKWTFRIFMQNESAVVDASQHPFEVSSRVYYLSMKSNQDLMSTCRYFAENRKNTFKLLAECSCLFDESNPVIWCSLVKWRRDKTTPNNVTVIQRTLCNVVDNPTIEDLIHMTTKKMYTLI